MFSSPYKSRTTTADTKSKSFIHTGYLKKQRSWTSGWTERYFILTSRELYYFKREPSNYQSLNDRRGKL